MYAVIRAGGKQQRVGPGDVIEVEFMKADPGRPVELRPLVIFDDDGKPHHGKELARAKVVARLLGDKRGEKVRVFKFRNKTGFQRAQGHRQMMTLLEIEEIHLSPELVARKPEPVEAEAPTPAEAAARAPKAAGKKPAVKKPAGKKPAVKKPVAGKPAAAKKPAARKPAAGKPASKKPAGGKAE